MRYLVLGILGLALMACSRGETPAQRVYSLHVNYAALLSAAVAYESQPRCLPGQTSLTAPCSDPAIVEELRAADRDLEPLLQSAQEAVRNGASESQVSLALNAASVALTRLRTVLLTRGVIKQ